jgi:hypothetical protein
MILKMTSTICLCQWSIHDVLTYCDAHTLFKTKCVNHAFRENSSSIINKSVIFYQKITDYKQFQDIFDILSKNIELDCVDITLDKSHKAHSINFHILQMNCTHEILINANLEFDGFIQKSHRISIDARLFVKHIKTHYFDVPTHMGIFWNKPYKLQLAFKHENIVNFGSFTLCKQIYDQIVMPTSVFDMKITLNAYKFHDMCNKMSKTFGTLLKISYVPNKLMFTYNGKYDSFEKTYIEGNSEAQVKFTHPKSEKEFHQVYHLEKINKFSRFAALSETVEIFLNKQQYPIALKYQTGCGEIIVFITPAEMNDMQRYESDDSYESDGTDSD